MKNWSWTCTLFSSQRVILWQKQNLNSGSAQWLSCVSSWLWVQTPFMLFYLRSHVSNMTFQKTALVHSSWKSTFICTKKSTSNYEFTSKWIYTDYVCWLGILFGYLNFSTRDQNTRGYHKVFAPINKWMRSWDKGLNKCDDYVQK